MDRDRFKKMLEDVASHKISVEEATLQFSLEPFEEIDKIASLDLHRGIRQGYPEVIYGRSKTPEQINLIGHRLWKEGNEPILITGMSQEAVDKFEKDIPFVYHKISKTAVIGSRKEPLNNREILVITAGTSDIPVGEEAAITAETFGNKVTRIYDVGVAGIHRLFSHSREIMSAKVIIAVAGMEGALASVVGGMANCPVIAVPTSVGYGTSFGGITALLSMLNSCASGVSVVNIDNGFGAGFLASMINRQE